VEALKQQNLIRRSLMKLIAAQLSKGTFLSWSFPFWLCISSTFSAIVLCFILFFWPSPFLSFVSTNVLLIPVFVAWMS
jgi:hypothetical protein